ncbi:hypothetical protein N9P00_02640 [Flavobacteriaceae bacterium]|nr:hypothetical protein [Flavobacteriaceae bacterium]
MDELELLKSKWQEGNQELPKLSYNDIYKMRHNKSASIVKWIFIISVCELVFWIVLGFLSPESNKELLVQIGLQNTLTILYGLHYVVIAVFLVLFYLNQKNIKTTDTVKNLMHSIIKTRKTVSYFVIYNVVSTALILVYINLYFFTKKNELYAILIKDNDAYQGVPIETFTSVFFITQFIVGILFIGLILLFYRIVYGILLRKLKHNYGELEKIEL